MKGEHLKTMPPATDPASWVDRHGDYLFRYALSRLRDREAAEDVVQETFLGALHSREQFTGASSERSWLVSILRHKIVDFIRRKHRERPAPRVGGTDEWLDQLFDAHGSWKVRPVRWSGEPGAALERTEFWQVFNSCLGKLSARLAEAFTLREIDGLHSHEVCKALDITANNLWVLLHRARLRLAQCLEANWFGTRSAR